MEQEREQSQAQRRQGVGVLGLTLGVALTVGMSMPACAPLQQVHTPLPMAAAVHEAGATPAAVMPALSPTPSPTSTPPAQPSTRPPAVVAVLASPAQDALALPMPLPVLESPSPQILAPVPPPVVERLSPQIVAAVPQPSQGYRLTIPSLGINAPVVEIGVEPDGALGSPDGPDIVGWYAAGPRPGSAGNVLMDGHVDWSDRTTGVARTAVFWYLKDLSAGAEIAIAAGTTQYHYRVRDSLMFAADDPTAVRVLAPTASPVLTLITCEGTFNASTHNYSQRRVVVAELARTS